MSCDRSRPRAVWWSATRAWWRWCTGRATTTGRCRRASSTPARRSRRPPCARSRRRPGCAAGCVRELPADALPVRGRPKVVRYWLMEVESRSRLRAQRRGGRAALARARRAARAAHLRARPRGARRPRLVLSASGASARAAVRPRAAPPRAARPARAARPRRPGCRPAGPERQAVVAVEERQRDRGLAGHVEDRRERG